ncbi:hypothetical protein MPSEU_000763500 [Mayamaea pseudoterrestris]|nr:hypothetical protein MPSEU_000763500 [Mayamaea pseudoterrestris]
MGSRSSRFFVVLLHLVGVSRFRPYRPSHRGLVFGTSIIQTTQQKTSSSSLAITSVQDDDDHNDSVWIQDLQSRDCLGPFGWSDCGDATQWTMRHVVPAPPHRLRMGLFGVKLAEQRKRSLQAGWRICLLERHDDERETSSTNSQASRRRQRKTRSPQQQSCLAVYSKSSSQVVLEEKQWKRNQMEALWRMDPNHNSLQSLGAAPETAAQQCLYRPMQKSQGSSSLGLTIGSCDEPNDQNQRKVNVSLIRYRAVAILSEELSDASTTMQPILPEVATASPQTIERQPRTQHFASHHAHSFPTRAPSLAPRPVLSSSSSPPALRNHRNQAHAAAASAIEPHNVLPYLNKNTHGQVHQALLKGSNPILLTNRINRQMMDIGSKKRQSSLPQRSSSSSPSAGIKSRSKIEIHPYFQAAKHEIWKDPSTGLEFATDLTTQLNRSRQEHGRHSLMGVGQYVKGFVIKVYGIAFYVSKRDALADAALEPFAGLSADELRQRPDFYQVLRTMGATSNNFERTLVLKTNMQLSADTMRSSLHADWSQLTDEMKDMLLNSSMEPRPADKKMLEWVQSSENPSRCSCSSVAPPEYNADPNCCARGTELAFTWLKSGDLEVRMNGHIMDTFPNKDMAEGIFYEYLRMDDPISTDFLNRVVDGFPFLLAPLAQVRGVHLGYGQGASKSQGNAITKLLFGMLDTMQSGASTAAGMIHSTVAPVVAHANHATKTLQDAAKASYKELGVHKDILVDSFISFPKFVMGIVSGENGAPILDSVTEWVTANITPTHEELQVVRRDSLGRAFGYPLSRWFSDVYQAPDEIGPMKVDPTMNTTRRIFLAFVHIYLLLLFIVSFPGSYSNRTRLIVRNNLVQLDRADNGSLSSTDESETAEKEFGDVSDLHFDCNDDEQSIQMRGSKRQLPRSRRTLRPTNAQEHCEEGSRLKKKSLSYFL